MLNKLLLITFLSVSLSNITFAITPKKDSIRVQQMPAITVTSTNAVAGKSAVAFSDISSEQIAKTNTAFDLPSLMSNETSVLTYSENGNGVGYSNIIMRGFDQRRISVMINGIPQNDPEDHNVYWINFSDIGESLDKIQIQRGAGLSNYGSAAIGGSINLTTSNFINNPGVRVYSGVGFQEFSANNSMLAKVSKFKFEYSSGLVDDKYAFYGKLGRINSFGYRDQSWALLNNYFLSAVRFDGNFSTQINIFGGSQDDALAYQGVPKSYVTDSKLRLTNYSYFDYDVTGKNVGYTTTRIAKEVEQFQQPHYEVLNNWKINDNWEMKSSLFYYSGEGYFDYSGEGWTSAATYGLTKSNGYADSVPDPKNPIIRSFVGNKHGGWIPRFVNKHENGELTLGAEIRYHRSEHWGKLTYAENLPSRYNTDNKFYSYNGIRDVYSAFAREQYSVNDKLTLTADAQLVLQRYAIDAETQAYVAPTYNTIDDNGNKATISNGEKLFQMNYVFVNPRLGATYKLAENQSIFASLAMTSREPRMENLYDASMAFDGKQPNFEVTTSGTTTYYNFSKPLAKPERMIDLELGYAFKNSDWAFDANMYYMSYSNELVKNGQLNVFGSPVVGNAPSTYHTGIELALSFKVWQEEATSVRIATNITYSINRIKELNYSITQKDSLGVKYVASVLNLAGNDISGFPNSIASLVLDFTSKEFNIRLNGKYIGKLKTDNFGNMAESNPLLVSDIGYLDNNLDSYFVMNMNTSYLIKNFFDKTSMRLQLQVNNLLNKKYAAYAIGKEFFPAAERNIFFGFQLEL